MFRIYTDVIKDCKRENLEVEILHNDTALQFDRINERNLPRDPGELYLGLGSEQDKNRFMETFVPADSVGQKARYYHSTTRYILTNQQC